MTALPSQPATPHNLLHAWLAALATVARDKGVLLLLIGAPVLYGFFYPWFYADEVLTRVPVAVVDMDRTSLSRQITRFADADPRIEVRLVTGSEHEAQQALWRGEIEGYAVIPPHLKRNVVRGENAVVSIEANGAYALLNKESPEFIKFVNPSDYRIAREACGACHIQAIEAAERSIMATGAMLWGGASYNNGILPFKNYLLGEAYTRDGAFTLDPEGRLTTEGGAGSVRVWVLSRITMA